MATAEVAFEPIVIQKYKVGERVMFTARINNPGHYRPDQKIPGTIIHVFSSPTQPPTYRIELDIVWQEGRVQHHSVGKKIIVGNVSDNDVKPFVIHDYACVS